MSASRRRPALPVFDALMSETFESELPAVELPPVEPELCYHDRASADGVCLGCGRRGIDASTEPGPAPLTVADLEALELDERWLGWGYLGGRSHLEPADRARADAVVLAYANEHGWDVERLFQWVNSKPGRWFADDPFGRHAEACLGADLEGVR